MTRTHVARPTEWTFADLADWYFAHYVANNLKESTQYNYRYIANRILLPHLGDVPQFRELLVAYYEGQHEAELMDFMQKKAYRSMD